jgi:hypothetical protein
MIMDIFENSGKEFKNKVSLNTQKTITVITPTKVSHTPMNVTNTLE